MQLVSLADSHNKKGQIHNQYLQNLFLKLHLQAAMRKLLLTDLSNRTETEAKAALNKLRLGVSVQKGSSDDVPEGQVYDQSPAAGVKTDVHTQVTIYISTGRKLSNWMM